MTYFIASLDVLLRPRYTMTNAVVYRSRSKTTWQPLLFGDLEGVSGGKDYLET